MKTLDQVKEEIFYKLREFDDLEGLKTSTTLFQEQKQPDTKAALKQKRAIEKRLELLRCAEKYLETDPREVFVKKQFNQVTAELVMLKQVFQDRTQRLPASKIADRKRLYEKENDMPTLRLQLKTLNYLLA